MAYPCVECGRSVSETLRVCPHCATRSPRGVACRICRQTLAASAAFHRSYHFDCYRELVYRLFSIQFECPECHVRVHFNPLDWLQTEERKPPLLQCPGCGRNMGGSKCERCGLPVVSIGHSYAVRSYPSVWEGWSGTIRHVPTCHNAEHVSEQIRVYDQSGKEVSTAGRHGCVLAALFGLFHWQRLNRSPEIHDLRP